MKSPLLRIAFALARLGFSGCVDDTGEEDTEECTPTPYNCKGTRPHDADLTIRVSSPLPEVVSIYAGTSYETGRLVWSGPPKGTQWSERLTLDD